MLEEQRKKQFEDQIRAKVEKEMNEKKLKEELKAKEE